MLVQWALVVHLVLVYTPVLVYTCSISLVLPWINCTTTKRNCTPLYSGVKFSGQYELNIAVHYSLLGVRLFRFFSQILYQGPNQLIYTPVGGVGLTAARHTASLVMNQMS